MDKVVRMMNTLKVGSYKFNKVTQLKYLCTVITQSNNMEIEI